MAEDRLRGLISAGSMPELTRAGGSKVGMKSAHIGGGGKPDVFQSNQHRVTSHPVDRRDRFSRTRRAKGLRLVRWARSAGHGSVHDKKRLAGRHYVSGAPDLVVEILSPGTAQRDQTLKAKVYERYGVRELWIASPEARTIEVLVNSKDGFRREAIYGYGDRLRSPLLPGLEIPLNKVF